MAFIGPNTQFKMTAAKFRRILRSLGFNSIDIYKRLRAFKLRKHIYVMTVSALSTATTAGSQYTSPNGQILTVQESVPVGGTSMRMLSNLGLAPDASGSLTYVASSSGSSGTYQASISYSSFNGSLPADLGPYQATQ
jgi:hypothetical protein